MSILRELVRVARPGQWTKNLVCLAALIFSGRLFDPESVRNALVGFVCFCLASSAVYVFNDIQDRDQDRIHPTKRNRPIAAGRLGIGCALLEAMLLAAAAVSVSYFLGLHFRWILALFLVLHVTYSLGLKSVAIVDVVAIAVGFVLRVQSGIEAIEAPQSAWIVLCIFFIALFMGFGKRRGELTSFQGNHARSHRPALIAYTLHYLDILLGLSATSALVCYSLYAVTVQTNETFLLTILPVVFGIFRYMMLVIVRNGEEGPDELLTRDVPLILTVLIWMVLCVVILYFGFHLFPPHKS